MKRGGTPYGIRTRVTGVKGQRPRPLDEGGTLDSGPAPSHRGGFLRDGGPTRTRTWDQAVMSRRL